jgi:integrase
MPRRVKELSALEVGRIKVDGLHAVGDPAGLALQITAGSRSWVLRYSFDGKRREMGLGSFPEIGLADARDKAKAARELVRQGVDPIEARKTVRAATKSAAAALAASSLTFAECAHAYMKAKRGEWKNAKHAEQWVMTLETYAFPVIGDMIVRDVDTPQILAILKPLWEGKTETAVRLRGRLEKILDYAIASDYRAGLNPARWRGHLSMMLAAPKKIAKREHHAALPVAEMPAFMGRLRLVDGESAAALQFAILTAARSGEVRGATWSEIELEARTWTIPAERMKAGKPHRVPLSSTAIRLLHRDEEQKGLLFPSARTGRQLSDMALTAVCRRMEVDAVPHGLARATFKTWATEQTGFPREVVEAALAHTLENKTEEAYWRGDLFAKRAKLMQAWADYCTRAPTPATVTSIERTALPGRQQRRGRKVR